MSKKPVSQPSTLPQATQTKSHEADPDTIVTIQLDTINGKPYFGQISDNEILYIWTEVFKRGKEELFGTTSTKTLTRNVRVTFKLLAPVKIGEFHDGPLFKYEKLLDDGSSDEITGRIIGYGASKPAEIGEMTRLTVTTKFKVEASGIQNWLKHYGTITSQKGFIVNPNTGLKTDVFETEILLKRHIPEYLPMYGQKCQINYPGIPRMCNRCYTVGHLRRDCQNKKRDWVEYIVALVFDNAFDVELIGTWKNAIDRWEHANANRQEKA